MLLPYGFTPADDFMLQYVLNHDGMNKLTQLSISISFTLWATCFEYVPIYVLRASVQSIRYVSHVLRFSIVSKNRSRTAKSR
jgi:hypothetical protein